MSFQGGRDGGRIEPRFLSVDGAAGRRGTIGGQGSRSGRGKFWGIFIAVVMFGGFGGVAWYATVEGQKDTSAVVPVIHPDPRPIKVLPSTPGGLEVPNRDKLVFTTITPEGEKRMVERLLPPPEEPLPKPSAPSAKTTPAVPPSGRLIPGVPGIVPPTDAGQTPRRALPPPPAPVKAKTKTKPKAKPKAPGAKPKSNAATAMAARGGFQVQFGAMKSKTMAVREASRISRSHRTLLAKLKVVSVRSDLGKKGIYYRLRAGPLKSRAAAKALCQKFAALKMRCLVVGP